MSWQTLQPHIASTKYLFFTGKGGNGKTSLSASVAINLARTSKKHVLLVSTDPASNLDEILGTKVSKDGNKPSPVAWADGLHAVNIDPTVAAENYRGRVRELLTSRGASESEISSVDEQLSGQCTVEIAAFDEFAHLLGAEWTSNYDHVVFDTAPTGHTLRLLKLPKAWSEFFQANTQGASCLGPVTTLKMQRERFEHALATLTSPESSTIVLVTRPETTSLQECARTSEELREVGLANQKVVINAVFSCADATDDVAVAFERRAESALKDMPPALAPLVCGKVTMKPFPLVGVLNLQALLDDEVKVPVPISLNMGAPALPSLSALVEEMYAKKKGLLMVMGKGGVGKTTVASSIAVALAQRGCNVHLSTTDPASHLVQSLASKDSPLPTLTVSSIDPKIETQRYINSVVAMREPLDEQSRSLLLEDLNSPCTEEVAVFEGFARVIAEAQDRVVVMDTAPTGHTLLLLDQTGAYDRELEKKLSGLAGKGEFNHVTPLTLMQNPALSKLVLVTLPEQTPVSEAASLQNDLRRAQITPHAWVVNSSLAAAYSAPPTDPCMCARYSMEINQIGRASRLAKRVCLVPWVSEQPTGVDALLALTAKSAVGGVDSGAVWPEEGVQESENGENSERMTLPSDIRIAAGDVGCCAPGETCGPAPTSSGGCCAPGQTCGPAPAKPVSVSCCPPGKTCGPAEVKPVAVSCCQPGQTCGPAEAKPVAVSCCPPGEACAPAQPKPVAVSCCPPSKTCGPVEAKPVAVSCGPPGRPTAPAQEKTAGSSCCPPKQACGPTEAKPVAASCGPTSKSCGPAKPADSSCCPPSKACGPKEPPAPATAPPAEKKSCCGGRPC